MASDPKKSITLEKQLVNSGDAEEKPEAFEPLRIVGVGASAGGLEAFGDLLSSLDLNTGMAYVLIQHLDPTHSSHLVEILRRKTRILIEEASDGVVVKPDHIYVIAPNTSMSIEGVTLRLTPRMKNPNSPVSLPVNDFFVSLADQYRQNAIGVILSGSGEDGSKGVESIMAHGGVTFAQSASTAKFDGMPNAAAQIGVDFVLSPEEIARELLRISKVPCFGVPTERITHAPISYAPEQLSQILRILLDSRGIDFSQYKKPTVERRILNRMAINKIESVEDYTRYLQENPHEIDLLYEDVLIKVTSFFRDPECYETLKVEVFPIIVQNKSIVNPIRIWVAGCATGEEAYSIAISLMEFLESRNTRAKIEIFATDISTPALAKARAGEYDGSIEKTVSPERLSRYFTQIKNGYRIKSSIRECCVFARQNVTRDPPFSRVDLISCRNLLIYLSPILQKKVLSTFSFALNSPGFLFLGASETTGMNSGLYDVVQKDTKIYSKRANQVRPHMSEISFDLISVTSTSQSAPYVEMSPPLKSYDTRAEAERVLLTHYVPPGVVINQNWEVIQFRGDTSPFLVNPAGDVTSDLLKMSREGLMSELQIAFHDADKSKSMSRRQSHVKDSKGDVIPVEITIIPFNADGLEKYNYVVLFDSSSRHASELTSTHFEPNAEIMRLQRELIDTKDYLNSLIEKSQTSNEELKSASEEIMSANEELQSTNEELATAKEESQAANEELITVNDELQNRTQELFRASNDLSNLFSSVQIPIVLVTNDLKVRMVTPSAERILKILSEDVGKSLKSIESKVQLDGLETYITDTLNTLNAKDMEVQDRNGKWYSLHIKPYRTQDNKIEGAVVALLDINDLKQSLNLVRIERDYATAIVLTTPIPMLVLDQDLKVRTANPAFCKQFLIDEKEALGLVIYDIGRGEWQSRQFRQLFEEFLPRDGHVENFMIKEEFKGLGLRTLSVNASKLPKLLGKSPKILIAIDDMTEEKKAEEAAKSGREMAEAANQAKTDFLANVSHEIRTPLAAIMGYAELMADPKNTQSQNIECANRIVKSGEQLAELVNEVLDIAKIEAGKLEIELVKFELLPELINIFSLLSQRATVKGLKFKVSAPQGLPKFVTSCPKRMQQILANVLGNAIKFTRQGGVDISIEVEESEPPRLVFVITDTGVGMTSKQQERLFQPFTQADSSVTRKFGGTGLGLVLARRLSKALGGNVEILASSPENGSTFAVSIGAGSLEGVSMTDPIPKFNLDYVTESRFGWSVNSEILKSMNILLVEDGIDNQTIVSHILTSSGAAVDLAMNGNEAIEKAQLKDYDVILMDIQMPELDGYEATKRLILLGNRTPIIALTAHAMQGEKERCLAVGCVDYISKPVRANHLVEIVSKYKNGSRDIHDEDHGFSELKNDPIVGPLVGQFIQNLSNHLSAILRAQEEGDWKRIGVIAHKLAGAAGSFGFSKLGVEAKTVEELVNSSSDARALNDCLKTLLDRCRLIIKAH